jgi:hypothetical protein
VMAAIDAHEAFFFIPAGDRPVIPANAPPRRSTAGRPRPVPRRAYS